MDITKFPKTKHDFISYCKSRHITSPDELDYGLPFEPNECYQDWTNWEQEMQLENDIW
jgi:hypothetical protein